MSMNPFSLADVSCSMTYEVSVFHDILTPIDISQSHFVTEGYSV